MMTKKLIKVIRNFIEFDRGLGRIGRFLCITHDKRPCCGCGNITKVLVYDGGKRDNYYWKHKHGCICQDCINALLTDTYRSESFEEDKAI